jgi:hypothetical protein
VVGSANKGQSITDSLLKVSANPRSGQFAGETACATTQDHSFANNGGAGIQPAKAFFRILLEPDNHGEQPFLRHLPSTDPGERTISGLRI